MADYKQESLEVDKALELKRLGLVWEVVGWTLLVFDSLLVVYVPIGFRTGSMLWFWWVVVEALLGLALIVLGTHWRSRAVLEISAGAHVPDWMEDARPIERKPLDSKRINPRKAA